MWQSLGQRVKALPIARRLFARPEREIPGLSVLFDRDWYLAQNPSAPQSDPLRHFLELGGFEGRDPSPLFDCAWYLERNPDVRTTGVNPLVHYAASGWREGRDPNPLFDCAWYLERNPDVRAAGVDPLVHYATSGWREGRDPHVLFDTRRLLDENPGVQTSGLDPLTYYLTHWKAGVRSPTPAFNSQWYLERYADVREAGLEPLGHYLRIGGAEGRSPNPLFDGKWYLERYPDVGAARDNPLVHYATSGWREGRSPNPLFDGKWYLERYPDACAAGDNPLVHYTTSGWRAGHDPHVLFDTRRFLDENPGVQTSGLDPLTYYLTHWKAGVRPPTPAFNSQWYLERYADVREGGLEPLGHYLRIGGAEGRSPNPLFDGQWYLERYPDVRAVGDNPLVHYATSGWREFRDPHVLFDTRRFLEENPDVQMSGLDPLTYYLTHWTSGVRPPVSVFRSRWYLEQHPDVREAGLEPLGHYLSIGAAEGRNPNPLFDGKWYREANLDIAKSGQNPLIHYLNHGSAEGRPANHLIKGRWFIDRVSDAGDETQELSWKAVSIAARTVPFGTGFDILADFSDLEMASIERLLPSPDLTSHAGGLTLVSREGEPPDPAGDAASQAAQRAPPTQGLDAAVRDAASRGHHLLILAGGVQPKLADVERLLAVFDADPMIGFVVPRFATDAGILPLLPPGDAEALAAHDRRILDHLAELQLAPEFLSPCMVLRAQLVANIPNFSVHFDTMQGALHAMLTWSRRIGYRAAVANRVALPIDEPACAYPELSSKEHETLIGFFPDAAVAAHRFKALSCHRRESLLAAALSGTAARHGRLLLDCSGMRPFHNGTSECVLGILDGLAQAAPSWQIDVLVSDEAAAFHRMEERYRMFNVDDDHRGPYTSAVRLSQPWTIDDIARLHGRALYIHFFIFDTISWDTIYSTLHEVEQTWAFAASHADGFFYDSNFTMGRFNSRFAVVPLAQQVVTHLSFNFDEYKTPAREGDREHGHVLIVGNDHDHKALDQALGLLPDAFPGQQFVTIGSRKVAHSNVKSIRSGLMSGEEIDRLFAEARMLVYPSFYEGFGLPILKGLSDGLDVIARRSELLYEVAANCAPRGRIVPFDDPTSMVAAVGQCLAGNAVETLPLGGALGEGAAIGWRDVALRIFDNVAAAAQNPGSAVHDRREAALKAIALPTDAQSWLGRMTW